MMQLLKAVAINTGKMTSTQYGKAEKLCNRD